jgi:hypothetical protein
LVALSIWSRPRTAGSLSISFTSPRRFWSISVDILVMPEAPLGRPKKQARGTICARRGATVPRAASKAEHLTVTIRLSKAGERAGLLA